MQVGKFLKSNKVCCTIIWETKVVCLSLLKSASIAILVWIFTHSCLLKGKARGTPGGGNGPGGGNTKRRTHADNIPDSEKPFSCERKYTEL